MIRCPHCGQEFEAVPPLGSSGAVDPLGRFVGKTSADARERSLARGDALAGFIRRYKRPAACDGLREEQALAACVQWSRRVAKLTVINQSRFSAVYCRLGEFDLAAVLRAIDAYADDPWHKEHPTARLDVADFFSVKKLEHWIGKAQESRLAREKRENARPPQPAVRTLCKDVAGRLLEADPAAARRKRWDGLPVAQRKRLWAMAQANLKARGWPVTGPISATTQEAMALMDQERAEKEHGSGQ